MLPHEPEEPGTARSEPVELDAGAVWQTFTVLSDNQRPGRGESWHELAGGRRIAWKTGTSIGFRDAWCVGVSPDYVVGVWIGNADGEGRPGVIGLETAAPLMFETFERLPASGWFEQPYDAMRETELCGNSGYAPNEACPKIKSWCCKNTRQLKMCDYDDWYHLDEAGQFRVNADCYDPYKMQRRSYFTLPPSQQYYYEQRHPGYARLPAWMPGCAGTSGQKPISLIYPVNVSKIYLPKNQAGEINPIVLRAAHRSPAETIFWHLDKQYLGETRGTHSMSLVIAPGKHVLTCVDQEGNSVSAEFEVVSE